MFDKADILARLQSGDTIEDIAKEMTDALNDADKAFQEENFKRMEEERVEKAKLEAAAAIVDGLCDYLVAAGEDELLDELHRVKMGKVVEMLDGIIEMAKSLEKLKGLQFPLMGVKGLSFPVKMPTVKEVVGNEGSADQVLNAFLKEFGL